jgi:D-amino peptidase
MQLEIDFTSVALADLASLIPVATRIGPRVVGFEAGSMAAVLGWINILSAASASLR